MSSTSAKDLLAQADRLMRQRSPEELPVLTDLVIEEIEVPSLEFHSSAGDLADARARSAQEHAYAAPPASAPRPAPPAVAHEWQPPLPTLAPSLAKPAVRPPVAPAPSAPKMPADVLGVRPSMRSDLPMTSISSSPITATAVANVREQFNAQLTAKLEELQHSVFSQVMQQLELHAAGSLKTHIRETLTPALIEMANEIAEQVAEDTSSQVRDVVSKAVDSEIARLREQLARRRGV